ncbi:MAG: sulfate reduction electron transfer complex DsrMKJOP subunit DsrM [Thermodesulfobacteriota bacterium]
MIIFLAIPLGAVGGGNLYVLFGVILPYLAFFLFLFGFIFRVWRWAQSPVPFRIPTSCGQQKSLPWIKVSFFDNPYNTIGVVGRMILEVFLFRSLFRNNKVEIREGRPIFGGAKWLWLGGLIFHWSFLLIVLRHMRFFLEPVPDFINLISLGDGFFEIGLPTLFLSDVLFLLAGTYLFLRRVFIAQVRYISLPADYFPLLLILSIAISGILMRHIYKVDLAKVKTLVLSLILFRPEVPQGIGLIFYVHLFLVCVLLAYLPMSKLMHLGGVFLSPTRNLANNSRRQRHINPWNYPVKVHTYEEYENEFREKMKAAGIPVEKE